MFHSNSDKALKAHYASVKRSLDQAAQAAHAIATAEHLPIIAVTADPEQWHRDAILKNVPVYGRRNRRKEVLPANAQIENGHAHARTDEWTDLEVKGSDFRRYLDWLHSIW